MFKKAPEQLTPAALENARDVFIRAHESVFERWFEKLEQRQRERDTRPQPNSAEIASK